MTEAQYFRRKAAGEYLTGKYGFGSVKTLAKLACIGGGPLIVYNGRMPLYSREALDLWALVKLSAPVQIAPKTGGPLTAASRAARACKQGES
jgi:hypothetical protein